MDPADVSDELKDMLTNMKMSAPMNGNQTNTPNTKHTKAQGPQPPPELYPEDVSCITSYINNVLNLKLTTNAEIESSFQNGTRLCDLLKILFEFSSAQLVNTDLDIKNAFDDIQRQNLILDNMTLFVKSARAVGCALAFVDIAGLAPPVSADLWLTIVAELLRVSANQKLKARKLETASAEEKMKLCAVCHKNMTARFYQFNGKRQLCQNCIETVSAAIMVLEQTKDESGNGQAKPSVKAVEPAKKTSTPAVPPATTTAAIKINAKTPSKSTPSPNSKSANDPDDDIFGSYDKVRKVMKSRTPLVKETPETTVVPSVSSEDIGIRSSSQPELRLSNSEETTLSSSPASFSNLLPPRRPLYLVPQNSASSSIDNLSETAQSFLSKLNEDKAAQDASTQQRTPTIAIDTKLQLTNEVTSEQDSSLSNAAVTEVAPVQLENGTTDLNPSTSTHDSASPPPATAAVDDKDNSQGLPASQSVPNSTPPVVEAVNGVSNDGVDDHDQNEDGGRSASFSSVSSKTTEARERTLSGGSQKILSSKPFSSSTSEEDAIFSNVRPKSTASAPQRKSAASSSSASRPVQTTSSGVQETSPVSPASPVSPRSSKPATPPPASSSSSSSVSQQPVSFDGLAPSVPIVKNEDTTTANPPPADSDSADVQQNLPDILQRQAELRGALEALELALNATASDTSQLQATEANILLEWNDLMMAKDKLVREQILMQADEPTKDKKDCIVM